MAQITLNSTGVASNGTLALQSNGTTTAVTIDASQNVGIGVTPSAWSVIKPVQVGNAALGAFSANLYATVNTFFDGSNWKYITSDFACRYQQSSGQHQWYTAASGTAGNTATFTQAMTLDASGNLGIGLTNPAYRLEASLSTNNYIGVTCTTDGNAASRFKNNQRDWLVGVLGGASGAWAVYDITANAERARIDSSGNLLVGTTTNATSSRAAFYSTAPSGGGSPLVRFEISTTANAQQAIFVNGNGTVGSINTSGTATSYITSSDYRLKNTVVPMTGALTKVAQLKPVTYKWNVDGSDGQGFIAHELQAVCPDAVTGEKDAVDSEGKPQYQGIDTSFLVATLTAAIQEQQALITQLQADVAALKGTA